MIGTITHVHAFSPMEILYGARRVRMDYPEYIGMLRDAGLGSIPGTAAEILDDDVREILSHKKVDVAAWVEIITTAHALGVPTTSTIMYGHLESPRHVINHLSLLRDIQKRTHGFTEFVDEVTAHEVSHQWWGHMVGWTTFHDQWLSEGFAFFSATAKPANHIPTAPTAVLARDERYSIDATGMPVIPDAQSGPRSRRCASSASGRSA